MADHPPTITSSACLGVYLHFIFLAVFQVLTLTTQNIVQLGKFFYKEPNINILDSMDNSPCRSMRATSGDVFRYNFAHVNRDEALLWSWGHSYF